MHLGLALLLVGLPVLLFLGLAVPRPGGGLRAAFGAAGLLLALLWLLSRQAFGRVDPQLEVAALAALLGCTPALGAAALAQVARPRLAARGRLVYPLLVVALLGLLLALLVPMALGLPVRRVALTFAAVAALLLALPLLPRRP